ncbi:MAG: 16S rRNA (adenine(1518)-N(6)/adenine(1519)-N(6))-dimethyltransferase RsmA [Coriobacteriia bacterium]|nr:16S rRNA (adenine(1518)-N(6)/adenine(1519)-N(6))-dimethyltransferase RsmA [Coriobacteriia bacterium]
METLATPKATQNFLKKYDLKAKYSLGQNFLVNQLVLNKIINLSRIEPGDEVIEVGPGIGTLTRALLDAGAKVIAIERDSRLVEVLNETLPEVEVLEGDALKIIPEGKMLISNLPYNIAAPLMITYFQQNKNLDSEIVMVQKEIADRILAKPNTKNYGAFTVKLAFYAKSVGSFGVSPDCFMPAPHVDSTVIKLDRIGDAPIEYCDLVDICFAHRRKTIENNLKLADVYDKYKEAFTNCNIDMSLRAESLTPHQFFEIASQIPLAHIQFCS